MPDPINEQTPALPEEAAPPGPEARRHAPATARNREPIAAALADWLPASGRLLELASGTGEHALYFAARFPRIVWQTSEPDPQSRLSIQAYRQDAARQAAGAANLRAPLAVDVTADDWRLPADEAVFDAMVCINMIHIAPWAAAQGLFAGAGRHLAAGGGLFVYGPFKRGGTHTAPSNAAFDENLRRQNPAWGVRDLEAVTALAQDAGLSQPLIREMPANNLALWFARQDAESA
ncbi:DUF938 domain-containing protein [Pelagibius litoralis]|uniref:DUF938 domain-containing protein n=1 Tax=Pelagibius litoralis TaxID=374515 RepID=A0A967F108_9PROT|nr:DUF938 domain-containing protein [Pelagibius litoralis]NIA71090.1 DUF938 domain-containing protein [Pelagibius litoralis]